MTSRLHKWLIGVLGSLCASILIINSFNHGQFNISPFGRLNNHQDNEIDVSSTPDLPAGFVVKTKGCRIPAFDVLDPSIKKFFEDDTPLKCQAGDHLPLVNSNLTHLFVDPKAQPHFYKEGESVDCCWRKFWRANQKDSSITFDKTCQSFQNETKILIKDEFVKVECHRNAKEIYKDYFAFVPRKPLVEKRCDRSSSSPDAKESSGLSVLILGLDAVSRLNFHRTMPETVETLKKLQAVEMLGYNKVADNTYPNMVPVLTGMTVEELTTKCWKTKKDFFDDCPLIWKNFSEAGYRTVFGEDACAMTIFNYVKSGFRNQPTDYYLRPYCIGAENDIGNTHKMNADICVGTRKTFDNLLSYGKKVAQQFADDPYFALFWQASLTHDYVTFPKYGDASYRDFLLQASEEGLLNRTALIMMSDHGIRWGSFRQTYQGHVEESLPFVFIVLPTWWREKFPIPWANLRRNSQSLTTPFDLHETLSHLLRSEELEEELLRERTARLSRENNMTRGLSWFLPIPDHRTCGMADIPGHWCMCHLSKNVSVNDPAVHQAVAFLVFELNDMVREYPQCALLGVKSILDAKVWSGNSRLGGKNPPNVDHTVTVQTEPGDAIFEATIRQGTRNSRQILVGSISRLNLYGKQSACVDDFKMRLYCYCRNR